MRNFGIGTALIILGAICAIFFVHSELVKEWMFISIGMIIIGGLFQLAAFLSAKSEMDAMNMKYELSRIQFRTLSSMLNDKKNTDKDHK